MDQIERKLCSFVSDYMDYLRKNNDNFVLNIYTSNDEESKRHNSGWYQYYNGHIINLNIFDMAYAANYIGNGLVDIDSFFAFVTLVVGHEYRHFLQGTCIYDGEVVSGFTESDAIATHLMMYIRYFFDAYYLLNKRHVKYEVDADIFGVIEGAKFLSDYNSGMDVRTAIKNAYNFYIGLAPRIFEHQALLKKSNSYEEVLSNLKNDLENNIRDNNLCNTLRVYLEKFYGNHYYYGLNEDKVITESLLREYQSLDDGFDKDLLVANRILELLERPEESLEQFCCIKKLYNGRKIIK